VVDFRMPSLGADMEAGTLVEWHIKTGDIVKRGDIVAVVETQKGAIEIETFQAGQVEQILVDLHSKVPVGTPLARIRAEGEAPATPPPVAPLPVDKSFHTTSLEMLVPDSVRLVPPHATEYGLEAGKSTWSLPSFTPSVDPLSPHATHTVTPTAAAACKALL